MLRSCPSGGEPPCRHAIGVTDDAAATWHRVALPAEPDNDTLVYLEAFDPQTAVLTYRRTSNQITGSWLTRDRGANFKWYPPAEIPPDLSDTLLGGLGLRCAQSVPIDECRRWNVVARTSGEVVAVVPFSRPRPFLTTGADGRLWLFDGASALTWLAVSEDQGRHWRELPVPQGAESLELSPDGREVWVRGSGGGGTAFWEFDGSGWQRRMAVRVETGRARPLLIGDGLWAVTRDGKHFYLKDGAFTEIPGIVGAASAQIYPDGSLVYFTSPDFEIHVGVGSGMDRVWIRITQ